MKTILFPTDFLANSPLTVSYLWLMAKAYEAKIIVLHVYQPVVADATLPTFNDPGIGTIAALDLENISQQHLTTMVEQLRAEGLDAVGEWRVGDVEDEIVDAARTYAPDLLITHRTPATGFFDRLMGSSATDVAREASCPVLFIGQKEAAVAVQIKTVAYVLQQNITQQMMTDQTSPIISAFDAHLTVITPEQIDETHPDLFVIQRKETGFLGGLMGVDPTEKLLSSATVPVLVFHEKK